MKFAFSPAQFAFHCVFANLISPTRSASSEMKDKRGRSKTARKRVYRQDSPSPQSQNGSYNTVDRTHLLPKEAKVVDSTKSSRSADRDCSQPGSVLLAPLEACHGKRRTNVPWSASSYSFALQPSVLSLRVSMPPEITITTSPRSTGLRLFAGEQVQLFELSHRQ